MFLLLVLTQRYLRSPAHTRLSDENLSARRDTSESGCPKRGWLGPSPPSKPTRQLSVIVQIVCVCVCVRHLSCGCKVLQRVDAEAQDVVVVAQVEALTVQLTVIDHTYRRHMKQHLATLSVEQVVPAVVATIPERHKQQHSTAKMIKGNLA